MSAARTVGGRAPTDLDPALAAFTSAQLEQARAMLAEAFGHAGLIGAGGQPVCPACGCDQPRKVVLRPRYWKCHRCKAHSNAVDLLVTYRELSFRRAVNLLLSSGAPPGPPVSGAALAPAPVSSDTSPRSAVDREVYAWIVAAGDRRAAGDFYARFGIDRRTVDLFGFVALPAARDRSEALLNNAVEVFGEDRLVACGVLVVRDDGQRYSPIIDSRYPILEVHRGAGGAAVGLQARAAGRQAERVAAHKANRAARAAAVDAGRPPPEKVPYVPAFLSLAGGGPEHLVGFGLPGLASAEPGRLVVVVEGGKDALAAATLLAGSGCVVYGLPGAHMLPPPPALNLLSAHHAVVAFDGDDAGRHGAVRLAGQLADSGVAVLSHLPDGADVADVLAARSAAD